MPDTAPDIVSNAISEHLDVFDGFPDFDPTVYRDVYSLTVYSLTDIIGFSVEYNRDTGINPGRHRHPGIHPR